MFSLGKRRPKYDVRKLARLDLAEDDILVIHSDERLSAPVADGLEKSLKKLFGFHREILVLDKGVFLTVIGNQKDENEDSSE
jgi:hypothetical protein